MKEQPFTTKRRTEAFAALGSAMDEAAGENPSPLAEELHHLIGNVHLSNPWFTPENVKRAVIAIASALTREKLTTWLSAYPDPDSFERYSVGVVMAGNIPLVGFHDALSVLVTGNRLMAKVSSKDEVLIRAVMKMLLIIEPGFTELVNLTGNELSGFDKVIATGSNNTSRYFEYYFRNIPSVIRHNRNSIAILDGSETGEELSLLADDIFSYFGLGCRNVSRLMLPEGYDIRVLTPFWARYETLREHYKYSVNYDHNKAVMIVNREPFHDTGFILLRESPSLTPPMAVLSYGFYHDNDELSAYLSEHENQIQCITGHGYTSFGEAQNPELWDYADGTDTISFLLKKIAPR